MLLGATLLVLEPRFDAEAHARADRAPPLTHAYLVPTMYVRLLQAAGRGAARATTSRRMRFVSSTGSPCPPDVKRAMIDWWGPVINESYAASELGLHDLHRLGASAAQARLRRRGARRGAA